MNFKLLAAPLALIALSGTAAAEDDYPLAAPAGYSLIPETGPAQFIQTENTRRNMIGGEQATGVDVGVDLGGRSELVEPDHAHFWQKVVEDERTSAWQDISWTGSHLQDGAVYHVLLFRAFPTSDEVYEYIDLKLAFDCSGKRIGMVESALRTKADGAITRSDIGEVTFDFAKNPPGQDDTILLDIACGKSED